MAAETPGANGNGGARPSPLKNPVTRVVLVAVLAVLVAAGVVWGLDWWGRGRFLQITDDAYLHADMVTAAPRVSGYVETVYVADNQPVSAGQPLVKVDERPYRASLAQALATVAARKADIARAEAEATQQQASIAQAKAQLAGAQVAAAFAKRQVGRYSPLAASGADTSERLDQFSDNQDQAQATVKANAAALDAAQRQVATLKAAVEQARAQLQAAEAQVRQVQIDLADTLVRSSLEGRVGDRSVRVGQYVQPGTRMLSIVPVRQIYLTANFKETQIGRMRVGQPATIRIDALPGETIRGQVESFAPGTGAQFALLPPENATGNFTKIVQRTPVRIRLDPGPEARKVLVPGLSATVTVDTRGAHGDLTRGGAR
jgi:membrane fusion protein, multidrug efflux system